MAVPDSGAVMWSKVASAWNVAHPGEPITVRVLSADANVRHNQLADAGRAGSGEFTVMALDPTWIPEFAGNKWVAELSAAQFPTEGLQPTAVSLSTSQGGLYGYPVTVDAGLLYYRKDLLSSVKATVPQTWSELVRSCTQVQPQPHGQLGCYGVGLQPSESLTIATAEAVDSAGGQLVTAAGEPALDTSQAKAGVAALADAVNDGTVAAGALGWGDDEAAQAFTDGHLVFVRGWAGTWSRSQATDGSSRVAGRVGVAPLVGVAGRGVPAFGGLTMAVSADARNRATADDVLRWLASAEAQRLLVADGSAGPALSALYADQALVKQYPYLTTLAAAIKDARPLPVTEHYADASTAIQTAIAPVLEGKSEVDRSLSDLQARLAGLLK